MNLGYACINMTIGKQYTTNRTMIKRTFQQRGLDYVSELSLKNASDIVPILEWNRLNGIKFFRLSSAIIPWGDHIDITQLKDYKEIKRELKKAGDFAKFHNMRITSHPGPFCVLTSPKESVVLNSIADLELHGKIFDMMGLSPMTNTYNLSNKQREQLQNNMRTYEDKDPETIVEEFNTMMNEKLFVSTMDPSKLPMYHV